ncbi:Uncharacterised protein [Vibrio cholerae]|nr:Uncharacterised protein [Vibrio cholerae]
MANPAIAAIAGSKLINTLKCCVESRLSATISRL